MNIKLFFAVLLLVAFLGVCSGASAQAMTEAQRLALVAQIQQQIIQLQLQVAQMLAQQQGSSSWCHNFNTNLGYSNSGSAEVFQLHLALQKQSISYSPDAINIYSGGTSQGVKSFQAKYGISQTGYVGPTTRAKLNLLYACSTTPITPVSCKPSWKCGEWGLCLNGQQSKTCTDSNNCGVTTGRPSLSQNCTQQSAVKVKVDNSDGPVNIFLTMGNGAAVTSSGINLTANVDLEWDGVDISSCKASDSITPTAFSGYKSSAGSQTVTFSGTIKNTTSSTDKITNTFKITCVSTKTGASVSDSVVVNLFYTVSGNCNPNWQCAVWTACTSSRHTRTCTDWNGCGSLVNKPVESESCVVPPVVTIKANNHSGSTTVASGSNFVLSWISTNATSCFARDGWSGTKATSGSETISAITSSKTFSITCTNAGGETASSVAVNVTGGT